MLANSKIAYKYADALFKASSAQGESTKIFNALQTLKYAFTHTSKEWEIINSQIYSQNIRSELIGNLSKVLKLDQHVSNLLIVMAKSRRLDLIDNVIKKFEGIYHSHNNETVVTVVSASDITKDQMFEIKNSMEEYLQSKVLIENQIDPSIIGGLIIKFGPYVLDNSTLNKLNNVERITRH